MGVTLRLNYTFTPDVSLQVVRAAVRLQGRRTATCGELSATPRAARYDDRYQPYGDPSVTNDPGGFNFKAFNSNVVFRWEYRPGLDAVRGVEPGAAGRTCRREGNDELRRATCASLFRLHPANTFLVKLSYWLNR